jgi:hypothetical protein
LARTSSLIFLVNDDERGFSPRPSPQFKIRLATTNFLTVVPDYPAFLLTVREA